MALAEQADLVVSLSLRDGLSKGVKNAQSRVQAFDRATQRTQRSLSKTSHNLKLFGLAAVGAAAAAVKIYSDFEDQLATINTVANVTEEQLLAIGDGMQSLAERTGIALPEIAAGYYDLVSAGVKAADAQTVLNSATTLAIGGLATTQETVDLLTTAINSYGLKAEEVAGVTDGFAQAIAAGKVTASELAGSFATVGPLASAAGIGIDELQAGYAQLTATGVPAAEAATQMRAAIVALKRPNTDLVKVQERLNVNFAKIAKNKGLQVAYQQLRKAAKDLGIDETELIGRVEALGYLYATTGDKAATYRDNLVAVRNASRGAGVAQEQFEKRQKTLSASLNRLRETARGVALVFGGAIAPAVQRVSNVILKLAVDHKEDIRAFATRLGKIIDAVTTPENIEGAIQKALGFLSGIDWSTVGSGFSITAQAAKTAVDAFNALDPDMQKALIAVLAANKLTGGLITSVVGDLAGVALKRLTTINAANVTVVGKTVQGGTPGPGGTPGGGGVINTLGRGLYTLGAVTLAAGSVMALADQWNATVQQVTLAADYVDLKASEARNFPGEKAITDLATYSKSFMDRPFWDRLVVAGAAAAGNTGAEDALINLADAITNDQSLNSTEIAAGLRSIDDAISTARYMYWDRAIARLQHDKNVLEGRLERAGIASIPTGGPLGPRYSTNYVQQPGNLLVSGAMQTVKVMERLYRQGVINEDRANKIWQATVSGNKTYREAIHELRGIELAVRGQTTKVNVTNNLSVSAVAAQRSISIVAQSHRAVIE